VFNLTNTAAFNLPGSLNFNDALTVGQSFINSLVIVIPGMIAAVLSFR